MTAVMTYAGGRGGTIVRAKPQPQRVVVFRGNASRVIHQMVLPRHLFKGGTSVTQTRQILERKMARIWELKDGWRGPGSHAPSLSAQDFFTRCYREVAPSMLRDIEPAPTADGGLHMEWNRGTMEFSAEITYDCNLILNVYAPDDADDLEKVVETPQPWQLKEFLVKGAQGVGH